MESGHFIISVDLGFAAEPTALAVVEPASRYFYDPPRSTNINHENTYAVVHLERFSPGTGYPAIVKRVREICTDKARIPEHDLLLNITAVGRPLFQLFRDNKMFARPFVILNGAAEKWSGPARPIAKKNLVSTTQIILQSKRLRVAPKLELGKLLFDDLLAFRMNPPKITDPIEAMRENPNDDLVFSVSLACWWGERRYWNDEDMTEMRTNMPPLKFHFGGHSS